MKKKIQNKQKKPNKIEENYSDSDEDFSPKEEIISSSEEELIK